MKRRVVVTGFGAITPVGNDVESTWSAILAGTSGAAQITKFDISNFPVTFACELKGFDPSQYMDRKGADGQADYRRLKNARSIDGLPAFDFDPPVER